VKPLLALLVVTVASLAMTEAQAASAARTELHFPGGASAFLTIRGVTYRTTLRPEKNVEGDIILVDLILTFRGEGRNLLEPKGNWHGIQPFDFGARDLEHGVAASIFGGDRVFPLGRDRLHVRVNSVKVIRGKTDPSLKQLSLDLLLERGGSDARR
jgi:hypothetical protein